MVRQQTTAKGRWLLLIVLTLASIVFTGCEKGSLGIKGGTVTGYVLNSSTNQPLPEVLVRSNSSQHGDTSENKTTYTGGDGSFVLEDLSQGTWNIFVEKHGYALVGGQAAGTDTAAIQAAAVFVNNGETISAPVIKMSKTETLVKGTLKGYPIDSITGRPLRNFTVTQTEPYEQRKSRLFETAEDFRDIGWSGLEGGNHHYTITANNYQEFSTAAGDAAAPISIGLAPANLGTINMQPHSVGIAGTLRNLPGYVLAASPRDIVIWAESAGKVVATYSAAAGGGDNYQGSVNYLLPSVPVSAGSVSVKCKIRGYDLKTINAAVSLASNMPGGIVAGVDMDFHNVEPIKRDVRVIVNSSAPTEADPGSFIPMEQARIYIKQGGKDIVPYVDVISQNYKAEAYIPGVITGYNVNIIAQNMARGYNSAESSEILIEENGNSAFTFILTLKKN